VSSVDVLAAQMVMRARQVERALHDPGPWMVRADGQDYPTRKVIGEDHVTFFSLVDLPWPGVAELVCNDDTISVCHLDDSGWIQVAWEFLVEEPVSA
jgi:hypothetical protein